MDAHRRDDRPAQRLLLHARRISTRPRHLQHDSRRRAAARDAARRPVSADDQADFGRDLSLLESELKRLEAEYNMYFAGRLPRPPWESRTRVAALVKRLDRDRSGSYADRFRFSTLQTRFTTF